LHLQGQVVYSLLDQVRPPIFKMWPQKLTDTESGSMRLCLSPWAEASWARTLRPQPSGHVCGLGGALPLHATSSRDIVAPILQPPLQLRRRVLHVHPVSR